MIEKPIALTLEGVQEIEEARQESGKVVFVAYMRRFAKAFLKMQAMVRALPPDQISYGELRPFTCTDPVVVRVRDIIGLVSAAASL